MNDETEFENDLTDEQMLIITFRAAKRLGMDVEWTPEGTLLFDSEEDFESEELEEAVDDEAVRYITAQVVADLIADGDVYVSGIAPSGEYEYSVMPEELAQQEG